MNKNPVVFITGFSKFVGRSYPTNILSLIEEIRTNNERYLPKLIDVSDEMSEFLENPGVEVSYNKNIPYHRLIVLVDLFRLMKMRELLNEYEVVGWVDADLMITQPIDIDNISTRFCDVYTKRPSPIDYSNDLSNGLMYTNNEKLLDRWIHSFTEDFGDEVDFSHFSRGLISYFIDQYSIQSLGDVISFTSYHNTEQWDDDLKLLTDNSSNLVGYNLSLSWKLDTIQEIKDKLSKV